MEQIVGDVKVGLDTLRRAHVEPMYLRITDYTWPWLGYKALPGYPDPRRPTDTYKRGWKALIDRKAIEKSRGDAGASLFGGATVDTKSDAHWAYVLGLIKNLLRDLDIPPEHVDLGLICDCETKLLEEIIVVRGGANWRGTNDEVFHDTDVYLEWLPEGAPGDCIRFVVCR
jgi:hypothetical protein